MAVNTSPRLRDSLDYEEPDAIDPRLSWGFRSLSIDSAEYEENEPDDRQTFAGSPDPSASRRRRRQRRSDVELNHAVPYQYETVADGDAFRLCVLLPGVGTSRVQCRLIWETSKKPQKDYLCLSYCWGTVDRDAAILCDGFRFSVTRNLLSALQSLRNPTRSLLIWVDQICINQDDHQERGHQVSIMKLIFSHAKEVVVWLGEADDRSEKLFEYARKMRRSDSGNSVSTLNRILRPRQLQDAIQRLLQRSWFQRVWVIPEVALARFTTVACGRSRLSWDNLVRLIRDVPLPQIPNFDKQTDLLGNPRQRIAIITQMIASQRKGLLHTDITQLLILAKSSNATDARDMVYAFYGIALLTTFPSYRIPVERLYTDVAHMYVNSILYEDYYARWHGLSEARKTQQLMSLLYSAGALHQHHDLPSWVPDFTYRWHLAPIWCKTTSNVVTGSPGRDEWTSGVRCDYRAGGEKMETFEVIDAGRGTYQLHLSVILVDTIVNVSTNNPASTPAVLKEHSPVSPQSTVSAIPHTLCYGRTFFTTSHGLVGVATEGIDVGDRLAVVLGGDVPIIIRPSSADNQDADRKAYVLLCECFVQSDSIMSGTRVFKEWTKAEDIVLV